MLFCKYVWNYSIRYIIDMHVLKIIILIVYVTHVQEHISLKLN